MEMKPELVQRLDALEKKFTAMGQDILSYLDGLLYADYLGLHTCRYFVVAAKSQDQFSR